MATLQDIKKRIRSVKNTGKITKAMKMVAAAKMRRAAGNGKCDCNEEMRAMIAGYV